MIFDCLRDKHCLKSGENIQVNMDSAPINDDFLILYAFIDVPGEKEIMLQFTGRNHPKGNNQMDQKDEIRIFPEFALCFVKKIHRHRSNRPTICKFPSITDFQRFENRRYFERKRESDREKKPEKYGKSTESYRPIRIFFGKDNILQKAVKFRIKTTNTTGVHVVALLLLFAPPPPISDTRSSRKYLVRF
jgi:hypothetical protein